MTTTTTFVTVTTSGQSHNSTILHCTGCQIVSGSLAPAVFGGLIGGFMVFAGVWCAEYLTRRREQTNRFRDEYWSFIPISLEVFNAFQRLTFTTSDEEVYRFMLALGRLRSSARPPQSKSNVKVIETNAVLHRLDVERKVWELGGNPPDMEFVLGEILHDLALRIPWWRRLWRRFTNSNE
jgi:hypothetical protein